MTGGEMKQTDSKVICGILLGGMLVKLLYTALFAGLYIIQRPLLVLPDMPEELRNAELLIFPSTWLIAVGICAAYWVVCLFARSVFIQNGSKAQRTGLCIVTGILLLGNAAAVRIADILDNMQMTAAVHLISGNAVDALAAHGTVTSLLSLLSPLSAAANDLLIIGVTAIVVRAVYLHKTAPVTGC